MKNKSDFKASNPYMLKGRESWLLCTDVMLL